MEKLHNSQAIGRFLGTFGRTDQEDPLKVWRFTVEIENFARFGFSKMTGLELQTDVVEYREGGNNATVQKSPGLTKFPDITFERGQIFAAAGNDDIMNWAQQVFDVSAKTPASANVFRRDIDIVQYSKEGTEVRRWRVLEAWVSQFKPFGDLDGATSDNSMEKMVITHEGFELVSSSGAA